MSRHQPRLNPQCAVCRDPRWTRERCLQAAASPGRSPCPPIIDCNCGRGRASKSPTSHLPHCNQTAVGTR
eukprot:8198005-Pyramimonas_sp.AAC.1